MKDKTKPAKLPEGWQPPFSIQLSTFDGNFYLRNADESSLKFSEDYDGNTQVLGGLPEAIEAIGYALNVAYAPAKIEAPCNALLKVYVKEVNNGIATVFVQSQHGLDHYPFTVPVENLHSAENLDEDAA